jgi:small-conductance mechanosensitive channel
MAEWFSQFSLSSFLMSDRVWSVTRALLVLVLGMVAVRVLAAAVARTVQARLGRQEAMIARRLVAWVLGGLVFVTALHQLGFNLGVLLGAAGVFTVAIGFASQTSASNLISGLFLMVERPFVVGSVVKIDEITGEVLSIDLLSVKLRTFDNLFVRVPNEEIIKKKIINLTHFPIRRLDLMIGVAYKEDLERVKTVLDRVADENPLCLTEPAPLFIFLKYGDSALEFQYSVWATRENFLPLRNSMHLRIKEAFDREGIEIPFPHRSLYTGSVTEPLPIRIVDERKNAKEAQSS